MSDDADDTAERTALELGRRTVLAAGAAGLGLSALGTGVASASHSPADKLSAVGSTLELVEAAQSNGGSASSSTAVTLLSGSMKTSSPTDLILQATVESGLYTDIKTKGNDESWANAGLTCWVEVDGEEVPVTSGSDGAVVFNNREFGMKTSNFENEEAMIELFLRTRSANAFNWLTLNVGSGTHTIELKADLDVYASGKGSAKALVGPRTLIVEPTKLANDATI
ncbi:hypothetical protein [Halobaculum marinum]|uniref:Uncharacterized protein n=1 Tax=Halobaculum marinum TaxID=3031996 RepID=A0ABD5WX54_9EURY|nr:hypothetical protein [Halobaculum sp. DT55]